MNKQVTLKDQIYTGPSPDIDIEEIVYGNPRTKESMDSILRDGYPFPGEDNLALLIYGPPGTGKTTLAHLLLEHLEAQAFTTETLNCPTGRKSVPFVELLIKQAQNNWSAFGAKHFNFVLNEVDRLSDPGLKLLQSAIEFPNTKFILTTNYFDDVAKLPSLVDRCLLLEMPSAGQQLYPYARRIAGAAISDDEVHYLVTQANGSFRQLVQLIQHENRTRTTKQTKQQLKVV